MKIERRIKFIRETERKITFSVNREPLRFFCGACDASAEMLSINEAVKRTAKIWREIVDSIENGDLHSTETEAGEIYVCAASLSAIFERKK
ncbi:MAG: hypothetical protein K1X72_23705 [Pyrinomonadaceae bacterium]|nr:hypothetical protein [Pyrinomonadaceae bacterium]